MFGFTPPAPSAAIHVLKTQRGRKLTSYCGQDVSGELMMPDGTPATCPVCKRKAPRP